MRVHSACVQMDATRRTMRFAHCPLRCYGCYRTKCVLSLCQFMAREEEFLATKIHFVQSRQVDTQSGRKPLKLTSVRVIILLNSV